MPKTLAELEAEANACIDEGLREHRATHPYAGMVFIHDGKRMNVWELEEYIAGKLARKTAD